MTYKEWEREQEISPISPEAYYATKAWNAAIEAFVSSLLMYRPDMEEDLTITGIKKELHAE